MKLQGLFFSYKIKNGTLLPVRNGGYKMKIALVTMNVKAGQCEENVRFMKDKIMQAREDCADLIVFPQNAVSGYLLGDTWLDDDYCRYIDSFNDDIIKESNDIAIVWGNIRYRNHRRFNAAFFAYQGMTHMRVKKNHSSPYMNDFAYFENNNINSAIEYKDDMIFALNFGNEIQLTDMNINLDARPYDIDHNLDVAGNVIYVNACGMQNNDHSIMLMEGGSCVYRNGKCLYHAPYFVEDYAIVDLDCEQEDCDKERSLLNALTMGIREFDKQVLGGRLPWVVGMSGGLDSSVTSALFVYALGKERVHGYNLATRHNSETTKSNARKEAEQLGIECREGAIEDLVAQAQETLLKEYQYNIDECPVLVKENLQARARGYLLNSFAGILGGVVINNANKVEVSLGYCTLYGDSVGAISPIADLTKVQLFDLSKELNKVFEKEVIPMGLLPNVQKNRIDWEMPPSAELKENQFDPMKWFYHDYLVEHLGNDISISKFIQSYEEGSLDETIKPWITYYGLDNPKAFIEDLQWFLSTQQRNSFKCLQLPPALCVHHKTYANRNLTQMRKDDLYIEKFKKKYELQ